MTLGWYHLARPLIERVGPASQELILEETRRYLAYREDKADDEALSRFHAGFT